MNILIVSSSLNADSRSRLLAKLLFEIWNEGEVGVDFLDLKEADLPLCDGGAAFSDERVGAVRDQVEAADAIVFASPVYAYSVNAAMKNLAELVGRSMEGKVAGFLCAAGGSLSYMSVLSFANSLMLDYRMVVLPRFVYATSDDWIGDTLSAALIERLEQFAADFYKLAERLSV